MQVSQKSKLLIVDDLPENRKALDAIIRNDERIIYKAASGEEALELLLDHDFALAIIDVQMPGMNGFELAELMRGTEKTRHIPIVFVTARNEQNYAFKGYESGAVDFLYKPLDINAVRSKVNVFVSLDQQRIQSQQQLEALETSRREQEQLLQELQATKLQLQRSLSSRDEFMSMVAHEMRTPLNSLYLDVQVRSVQLAQNNMNAFQPDQIGNMLERNQRQLKNLIRLIDDMLDVSRIRNGKLSIRPDETNLSELVERVISDLSLHAETSGTQITLHQEEEITGVWDAFRIEQIIINLLTNAIRYGKNKQVQVTLYKNGNQVRVDVRDHGVGISEEEQKRIFDPFERGTGNKVSVGLGLGLYISKQLAEAHHGNIIVESKDGDGSMFSLIMPLELDD